MIQEHNCENKCCSYKTINYKQIKWDLNDGWKSSTNKIIKAGCFIIDPSSLKILLVYLLSFYQQ